MMEQWMNEGIKAARAGQRKEAARWFYRVAKQDPNNQTAWLYFSDMQEDVNKQREILVWLSNRFPENQGVHQRLQRLDQAGQPRMHRPPQAAFEAQRPSAPAPGSGTAKHPGRKSPITPPGKKKIGTPAILAITAVLGISCVAVFAVTYFLWKQFSTGPGNPAAEAALPGLLENMTDAISAPQEYHIGSTKVSEVDGMEMVYVPAGYFMMGSNEYVDEQPVHEVYLDGYWIDKYEVTNEQYKECVVDGACDELSETYYYDDSSYADHPVVYVDWYNAQDYCAWVGRRLPSEAEWEKAARGQDERTYPWGNQDISAQLLNYNQNGTTEVGSYPDGASPYGVLDMAGNVWEWTADWYDDNYYNQSPDKNPTGPASGSSRVLRGGSWYSSGRSVRSTSHFQFNPDYWVDYLGFRCASSP